MSTHKQLTANSSKEEIERFFKRLMEIPPVQVKIENKLSNEFESKEQQDAHDVAEPAVPSESEFSEHILPDNNAHDDASIAHSSLAQTEVLPQDTSVRGKIRPRPYIPEPAEFHTHEDKKRRTIHQKHLDSTNKKRMKAKIKSEEAAKLQQQTIKQNIQPIIDALNSTNHSRLIPEIQIKNEEEFKQYNIAFLDLEWHQLNQKHPYDMNALEKGAFLRSNISQMSAFSWDYSIRFNEYVFYKPLAPNFTELCDANYVTLSKQDDPQIALPIDQCIMKLCDKFPPRTIFLYYGFADAPAIFRNLRVKYDVDNEGNTYEIDQTVVEAREKAAKRMREMGYRWGNIQEWLRDQWKKNTNDSFPVPLDGSLERLYDALFHKSILVDDSTSPEESVLVHSDASKTYIDKHLLPYIDYITGGAKQFGLIPREWLKEEANEGVDKLRGLQDAVPQFWDKNHLEPVWHLAHTDTIMMMNCIAIVAMFNSDYSDDSDGRRTKNWLEYFAKYEEEWKTDSGFKGEMDKFDFKKNNKKGEVALRDMITYIANKTEFFRRYQIALSKQTAHKIANFYLTPFEVTEKQKKSIRFRLHTSKELLDKFEKQEIVHIKDKKSKKSNGVRNSDRIAAKGHVVSYKEMTDAEFDQEMKQWDLNDIASEMLKEHEKVTIKKHLFRSTTDAGVTLTVIGTTKIKGSNVRKVKTIRSLLGKSKDTTISSQMDRKTHFFSSKRERMYDLKSTFDYTGLPWITSLSAVANVTPRTEILHTLQCMVFSDPTDRKKTRNFAELHLKVYDFDLMGKDNLFVNTNFQFCKECKLYAYNNSDIPNTVQHSLKKKEEVKKNKKVKNGKQADSESDSDSDSASSVQKSDTSDSSDDDRTVVPVVVAAQVDYSEYVPQSHIKWDENPNKVKQQEVTLLNIPIVQSVLDLHLRYNLLRLFK
jgi:hypothetical protein